GPQRGRGARGRPRAPRPVQPCNTGTLGGIMHDYTEAERRLLMDSAAAVLLAAVTADRTGPLSYFAEMTAAGTFLYDARQRYRDNPLVLELLDHAGREDVTAPEEVTRDSLLRLVRRAGDVLRDDEHGRGFKRFL